MSTKTTFKRIALVAVAALGFGMLSVIPSQAGPAGTAAAPWEVTAAQTETGTVTARTATQIAGANNYVELTAAANSTSTLSVLKVTGSTFISESSTTGTANVAGTEIVFVGAVASGDVVKVATPAAGTVTAEWFTRAITAGVPTDTSAQKITITVSAVKTVSDRYSTATIAKNSAEATVAGSSETNILAPKGTLNATPKKVASISISFKDSADAVLSTPTGEFPAVRAVITGPGNIQFNGETANGRDITLATKVQAPVIDIYNDGTGGKSTVDIYVGGVLWKSKSLSFYGAVTTLTATQGLYVAPTTGGAWGCGSVTATCDGSTVALTPAATLKATDANGIAVPFLTIGASSSDTAVFASSTTSAESVATGTGSYNANVSAVSAGTSGKTAAITFRTLLADGVTYVSATPLTYAIGTAMTAVAFTVTPGSEIGRAGTMAVALKDVSGNKPFDAAYTLSLVSNVSLTGSVLPAGSTTISQASSTTSYIVVNGAGSWTFFNPLVEGNVSLAGSTFGAVAITASWEVGNATSDLASEAIDAANAATDAANAAAEAADAATAAAQDAADAVAALSTSVSAMITALKKQITTLTNLVIKIQKKVKA
jgi:trimeric autotransporter adhesin